MKRGFTPKERREVLGHYDRMLGALKGFKPTDQPSLIEMKDAVHEAWDSKYCYLCLSYDVDCKRCPMQSIPHGPCIGEGSLWYRIARATTWLEWASAARALRDAVAEAPAVSRTRWLMSGLRESFLKRKMRQSYYRKPYA